MEAPRVWFRNSPNAGAFHLPGAIGKALCGHDLSRPSCALDTPSIVHFKDQRICKVCRAMSEGHWAKRS